MLCTAIDLPFVRPDSGFALLEELDLMGIAGVAGPAGRILPIAAVVRSASC
jgi:hypothetical protein